MVIVWCDVENFNWSMTCTRVDAHAVKATSLFTQYFIITINIISACDRSLPWVQRYRGLAIIMQIYSLVEISDSMVENCVTYTVLGDLYKTVKYPILLSSCLNTH